MDTYTFLHDWDNQEGNEIAIRDFKRACHGLKRGQAFKFPMHRITRAIIPPRDERSHSYRFTPNFERDNEVVLDEDQVSFFLIIIKYFIY